MHVPRFQKVAIIGRPAALERDEVGRLGRLRHNVRKERMEGSPAEPKTQGPREIRPWREVWAVAKVPMAVSTWFGAGFLPIAPGTWGSLAAIPVVHLFALLYGLPGLVAGSGGIALMGLHAAPVTAALRGVKDPSEVVVDEVAGQSISLVPIYALLRGQPPLLFGLAVAGSFLLFRGLDVVKPGPIRR